MTVYICPKCGGASLEGWPCVFDQHDGNNHGPVEPVAVEYVPRGSEVTAVPARLHGLPDADSLLDSDDTKRGS